MRSFDIENAPRRLFQRAVKCVHWQEGDAWLGDLQDHPDYWTQGETLEDLLEHLRDLQRDLTGGGIPGIRKVGELAFA